MANIFKNLLNGLNLTEDDEDFDDEEEYSDRDRRSSRNYYDEEDEIEEEQPRKKAFRRKEAEPYEDSDDEYEQPKPSKQSKKGYGRVVHMKSIPGGGNMEVRVIAPKVYDDSREISDTLNSGISVVLNLTGIDSSLAQRILDFTSGAVYAMNGNLQEVVKYVYIVTPNSVPISGNFDEMIESSIDLSGNTKYVFRD